MTTGCGILFLIDEDVIAEAKWIRSNSEIAIPPKRVQSPPKITKSRRCRYILFIQSRKSYVLQDFRKLGMGVEIIVNMFQG